MKELKGSSDKIIRDYTIWSIAAGLVPVPFIDIASVSTVQTNMLKELCNVYKQDYSVIKARAWITTLAGSTLARFGASAIKTLPVFGSILGGVSMAVLSAATTHALGEVLVYHFDNGGDLDNFNKETLKNYYNARFEEGKKVATEYKDKMSAKMKQGSKVKLVDKLTDLAALKEKNMITDEEYKSMKEKIIDEFIN